MTAPAYSFFRILTVAAAPILIGASAANAQRTVIGLGVMGEKDGTSATTISADGEVVVGATSAPGDPQQPIRWTVPGGVPVMEPLARPKGWMTGLPLDLSDDGAVALVRNFDGPLMTYRWHAPETTSLLPMLPGWIRASGAAVTSDGASIFGTASLGDGTFRVVRWTGANKPAVLPLPDGATSVAGPVLDAADNVYAIGFFGDRDQRLIRLSDTGAEFLTSLPYPTEIHGVSADGSTFLLKSFLAFEQEDLLVWTEANGFSSILRADGSIIGLNQLTAVMADGSVVFGQHVVDDGDSYRFEYFAWTPDGGVISTSEYIADLGVDLMGWTDIAINDVSGDGARLVGGAIRSGGRAEAILIDLIGFCAADFNDDDVLNSQDLFDFLGAFFSADPGADFNEDGAVNSQDFFDFLAAFFGGCE